MWYHFSNDCNETQAVRLLSKHAIRADQKVSRFTQREAMVGRFCGQSYYFRQRWVFCGWNGKTLVVLHNTCQRNNVFSLNVVSLLEVEVLIFPWSFIFCSWRFSKKTKRHRNAAKLSILSGNQGISLSHKKVYFLTTSEKNLPMPKGYIIWIEINWIRETSIQESRKIQLEMQWKQVLLHWQMLFTLFSFFAVRSVVLSSIWTLLTIYVHLAVKMTLHSPSSVHLRPFCSGNIIYKLLYRCHLSRS